MNRRRKRQVEPPLFVSRIEVSPREVSTLSGQWAVDRLRDFRIVVDIIETQTGPARLYDAAGRFAGTLPLLHCACRYAPHT